MYFYNLYGLHVTSEEPIRGLWAQPQTEPSPADESSTISIRFGATPDTLPDATSDGVLYQIAPRDFLLTVPEVARYHVHDGRAITIEVLSGADAESVQLFLLGSALGALLHQRGMLPLHASAVETPAGAALFTGVSGAGKSTTAAALTQRGYRLLADDITVVFAGAGNVPMAAPAFPQMKLWAQSLEKLATAAEGLQRVRPELEKFALPVADSFRAEPLRIFSIYLLQPNNEAQLEVKPVSGMMKVRALRNQVYRRRIMEQMGADSAHFGALTALAKGAQLSIIKRPHHPFLLDELMTLLEADFAAAPVLS